MSVYPSYNLKLIMLIASFMPSSGERATTADPITMEERCCEI
jgi:hypothetical protein